MAKQRHSLLIFNTLLCLATIAVAYLTLHRAPSTQPPLIVRHSEPMRVSWQLTGIIWDPSSSKNRAITIKTKNGQSKLINNGAHMSEGLITVVSKTEINIKGPHGELTLTLKQR